MRVLLLFSLLSASAAAAPLGTAFTYQGELKSGGSPATGLFDFQVCLFDSADSDLNPIPLACAPVLDSTPVENGRFTLNLDFGATAFNGEKRFLEIRLRPDTGVASFTSLSPRQPIRATPEATRASTAPWAGVSGIPAGFADGVDNVGTATVTSVTAGMGLTGGTITTSGTLAIDTSVVQARVTGACVAGQFVTGVGADGSVTCVSQMNPGGDITAVTAGVGLTGGAVSGDATLSVDSTVFQARITGACSAGQYVIGVGQDGSVVCANDANSGGDVTAVSAGPGLTGGAASGEAVLAVDTTAIQTRITGSCAVGQYITSIAVSGAVTCASDLNSGGDITGVSAGMGLTGGAASGDANLAVDTAIVQSRVTGTCAVGQYITAISASGAVTCAPDADSGGDITGIAAGMGLTGGGTTGQLTLSIDPTAVQARVAGSCAPNQYMRRIESDGSVQCDWLPGFGPAAEVTVIDESPSMGEAVAVVIGADGLPLIGYHYGPGAPGPAGPKFAKCATLDCSTSAVAHVGAIYGQSIGVALASDGFPIAAYSASDGLTVVKCTSHSCGQSLPPVLVDSTDTVSVSPVSITRSPDGNPLIAYRTSSGRLKAVKCSAFDCSGTPTISTLDSRLNNTGADPTAVISVAGLPLIAYMFNSGSEATVARCAVADCSTLLGLTNISGTLGASGRVGFAIGTDGLPILAFNPYPPETGIKVAKCADTGCSSQPASSLLDGGLHMGKHQLVVGVDGNPVIVGKTNTGKSLVIATCSSADCSGPVRYAILDTVEAILEVALGIGSDGFPIVAYIARATAGGNLQLRMAKCSTRSC